MMLYFFDQEYEIEHEISNMHFKCVNNIANLFKELNLNNIHEQFYTFCYLLWNGYLSVDKIYFYDNKHILDENNTIFLGNGCCRHHSKLLTEVFNKINVTAQNINIRTIKIELNHLINIERNIKCNEQNTHLSIFDYDHAVTIVLDSNHLFMLDPTNLLECEIIKNAKLVCFDGKYKINRIMLLKELKEKLKYNNFLNRREITSTKLILDSYLNASNICIEQQKLLDDFYNENHQNYEKIKELVLKIF